MAELQERIAQANKELSETIAYQNLSQDVNEALEAQEVHEEQEAPEQEPGKESIELL